jgi:hypothetical protein
LQKIEVARVADLDIAAAGDGRVRVDQLDRIEQRSAIVALVAAGFFVAAVRAGALDIAIRQEALVVDGVDLFRGALVDQAVVFERVGEVLGELAVGRVGRAAEPVERQAKACAHRFWISCCSSQYCAARLAGLDGGEFGRACRARRWRR